MKLALKISAQIFYATGVVANLYVNEYFLAACCAAGLYVAITWKS